MPPTGPRRPSSAAFDDDSDGMSVYRQSILDELGLGPRDVILGLSGTYCVVELTVVDLRSAGLGIRPDPDPPDSDHVCDPAHALVRFPADAGKKARLRLQRHMKEICRITIDDRG
jgi:hypothetical protein